MSGRCAVCREEQEAIAADVRRTMDALEAMHEELRAEADCRIKDGVTGQVRVVQHWHNGRIVKIVVEPTKILFDGE